MSLFYLLLFSVLDAGLVLGVVEMFAGHLGIVDFGYIRKLIVYIYIIINLLFIGIC
jgi:hypothetical protein